jgi:inorganic pyrophosphatase
MGFPSPFYRWRPHPWHGLAAGPDVPRVVHAYVEITPFDSVKYEIDKETGYLRVDRPQRTSSSPPTLYGFIPRTFCGPRVAALSDRSERGDGDPLDVCVVSERPINRAEVLLVARVVGGMTMLDGDEADDKIVAVLENDAFWSDAHDIAHLPRGLIDRLRHYFETYKIPPGSDERTWVSDTYGADTARRVVQAALEDYEETFGE